MTDVDALELILFLSNSCSVAKQECQAEAEKDTSHNRSVDCSGIDGSPNLPLKVKN
jgi:hypothetical protein